MAGYQVTRLLIAITTALEALEVGDQRYAVNVLLNAREDGPAERPYRCGGCSMSFQWPGLRDAHVYASGHALKAAA